MAQLKWTPVLSLSLCVFGTGLEAQAQSRADQIQAERIAKEHGFERMAVISAVGTRGYYLERGFERGEYYLVKQLR